MTEKNGTLKSLIFWILGIIGSLFLIFVGHAVSANKDITTKVAVLEEKTKDLEVNYKSLWKKVGKVETKVNAIDKKVDIVLYEIKKGNNS